MHALRPGRATKETTHALHASSSARGVRAFGDLALSSVGLGTYLGAEDDATDRLFEAAIARALDGGLNVIDTAVSYRAQRSERAIGRVLGARIDGGQTAREAVIVASKAGYVPFDGARPRDAARYLYETFVRPGLFAHEDLVNGVHCMAPRFLDAMIDRSRENLGLATIDLYYLHNPESGLGALDDAAFHRRVAGAFEVLEAAARSGRIGCFGVATWHGFRKPPGQAPHHSLERLLALARAVGGDSHHLRVIQLPYSLALIEAAHARTQEHAGATATLLECARDHGVYVMASAPLLQGQLVERLPEHLRHALGLRTDAQRALQFARSTSGVGTALVGTKQVARVDEALEVSRSEPVPASRIDELLADA